MSFDAMAAAEITKLKAALEVNSPQLLYNRQDTLGLIALLQLATGQVAIGGSATAAAVIAGSTAVTTADPALAVAVRPDSMIGVSSLPGSVAADIAAIKNNTARLPQSSYLIAEDTSGATFLVRIDNMTQSTSYINLTTGLSYVPIGNVELTDPYVAQVAIQTNEFEAITVSAGNWAVGDILTKLVVTSTAGATVSTIWQSATGAVLATLPVVGTDAVDRDKQELTVLRSINTKLPVLGQALVATSSPVVLPATQVTALTPPAAITGFALDASINTLLKPASTLAAVGTVGAVTAITNALPAGANLLGKTGIDQTTQGTTNFVTTNNTQVGGAAIAVGLGAANAGSPRVAVASDSRLVPWDGITAIAIKAASAAAVATDPALVVATRPDSTIGVSSLPASFLTDIAAIKTNTAKISQYSFQLAEDTAGTLCIIKTDTITGASSVINASTGLVFVPSGQLELTDPIAAQVTIEQNEYEAITTNAGNWIIGDIVERIRTLNTSTGIVNTTNWYGAAGALLSTVPVVGTDVIDSDKQSLVVLRSVDTKLINNATTTLQSVGNASLGSIDSKTPAVGQALAAASSPVVLPAAQITALTPAINAQGAGATSATTLRTIVATDDPQFGNKSTAAALPTGGLGLLGWLSDTYRVLLAALPTSLGTKLAAASFPVTIASDCVALTTDAANGSVTGGVAGAKSELIGGVFNTTAPTLTNGQQAAAQFDANGNLKVTGISGGGGGTQLFRASAAGTGYAINDLLEFSGTAWRNITNPAAITTLGTVPGAGTIYPVIGGNVTGQVVKTDRSGSIATSGVAQQLMAVNNNRYGWSITNKSNSIIFINELTVATGGISDYPLMPNETKAYGVGANVPATTTAISIISTQAAATFSASEWSNPSTSGSTLFVSGATPNGSQSAANSYSVNQANNSTIDVNKEWIVSAVTGTPAAAVGDILMQTIRSNGGSVVVTWFNLTSSALFTVAPSIASLAQNSGNGQNLPATQNGRQMWSMVSESLTSMGTSGTIQTGFTSQVDNVRTTGVTTYTVPANKRLRIVQWGISLVANTTIPASGQAFGTFHLRYSMTGGAITATSPSASTAAVVLFNNTATSQASATAFENIERTFADGVIDLPPGSTFAVVVGSGNNIIAMTQSIQGYLYNAQ